MDIPGVGQLFDEIDEKILVYLRDGRTFIGVLRCIDQYASLVLHRTVERVYVGRKYGDIARNIVVIRGENVVYAGLWDDEKAANSDLVKVSSEEILEAQQEDQCLKKRKERLIQRVLVKKGVEPELGDLDNY